MTTTPETENETMQTPEQLIADLGELHTRTLVSPLPKHPAAMGWQAVAGSMTAGFTRALHALNGIDPAKAQEIVTWFQGPFEDEGPDPEEHTDWLEREVAKGDLALMEKWVEDGRRLAESSKEATEKREKEQQAADMAALQAQVKRVRDWATSHEYRWLHELLDGPGTHGGHL